MRLIQSFCYMMREEIRGSLSFYGPVILVHYNSERTILLQYALRVFF